MESAPIYTYLLVELLTQWVESTSYYHYSKISFKTWEMLPIHESFPNTKVSLDMESAFH